MVMRITDNMRFNNTVASLANAQSQYDNVMEKMGSQKKINRISDDPLGMTMLLGYRKAQTSIDQYQRNIDNSNGWLAMTESKLTSAGDLLTKAREVAVGQGTATASAETRRIAADNVQQLKEEMLSLANSQYGGRYLFSGSRMDAAPFSTTSQPASIDSPSPASSNYFDGNVAVGGTYSATRNNTFVVKIINGGTLADATYQTSSDGGKTWGVEQTDLDIGTINLPDGITVTFTDSGSKHLAAGDMFSVHAYAAGYYRGDNTNLTMDVGKDATINYNITGETAFVGLNGGTDVFKALDDLKSALTNNDPQGILDQIDRLKTASDQVNLSISKIGTAMNRIDVSKSNLQDFRQQLTNLTSQTEDADIAELSISLATRQLALQACYSLASKIGNNTILDFIK
jgi:flagellar hook-associated protein 3 FlgL